MKKKTILMILICILLSIPIVFYIDYELDRTFSKVYHDTMYYYGTVKEVTNHSVIFENDSYGVGTYRGESLSLAIMDDIYQGRYSETWVHGAEVDVWEFSLHHLYIGHYVCVVDNILRDYKGDAISSMSIIYLLEREQI